MMEAPPRLNDRVLLDDSLRPFWMLLHFNGLHPDWCGQHQRNRLFRFVRFIVTFVAVLLVSTNCLSSIYLLFASTNLSEIGCRILYRTCLMTSGLHYMYRYMRYGDDFLKFFSEWRQIEINFLNGSTVAKKRRINKLLYILSFGKLLMFPLLAYFSNIGQPNLSFYFICDPASSKVMPVHSCAFISAITDYICRIYITLGEAVPTLFFYHVGCVVEEIQRELQETFFSIEMSSNDSVIAIDNTVNFISHVQLRNVNTFQRVWEKFETVHGFVNRANQLLGASIFCIDISAFLSISLGVCNVLMYKTITKLLVLFVRRITEVLQFVLMNRLMSRPTLAQEELKTSFAALLSQKWQLLCEDERSVLVAFQARLDSVKLAASPFNLYKVKPSNILSMVSLVITYVFVLIQFDP